jgi:hypothetical protein
MVLADEQLNGGANRDRIRAAFQRHNIMLGANALLAPAAALAGAAPGAGRAAAISAATRKDLLTRLGAAPGTKLSLERAEIGGQRFVRAVHTQRVALGSPDNRLKGVTIAADVPVMADARGARRRDGNPAGVQSTEHEVHGFVESPLAHGQIEFGRASRAKGRRARARARRNPCRARRIASRTLAGRRCSSASASTAD